MIDWYKVVSKAVSNGVRGKPLIDWWRASRRGNFCIYECDARITDATTCKTPVQRNFTEGCASA